MENNGDRHLLKLKHSHFKITGLLTRGIHEGLLVPAGQVLDYGILVFEWALEVV